MPVLEITPEMVGPNRTRLALAYVGSVMLWPHDEERRGRAIHAARVAMQRVAIGAFAAVPAASRTIAPEQWLQWLDDASAAAPLAELSSQTAQPRAFGWMAGELLLGALQGWCFDGRADLGAVKKELIAEGRKGRKEGRFISATAKAMVVSPSTLDNTVWAHYRPVAHLWAAHIYFAECGDPTFPCRLERLPEFLGCARSWGRYAASIRPKGQTRAVVSADRMWKVPEELHLPDFAVVATTA